MNLKKNLFSNFILVLVGLAPFLVTVPAYAANGTANNGNFFSGLVQFISSEFHLDQTKVQSVVNTYASQQQQKKQQKMQDNEKKRLDNLVSQGKITASQEQQILDEQAKLKSEYSPANFKNETSDQRKANFQKEQAEIKAWSQSTGIDAKYLLPGFGMRMHMFNRWNKSATPTPTPSA